MSGGGEGEVYEFVVGLHASQDEAIAFGCPELGPLFLVLAVNVVGEVLGPVYSAGFGVADVGYVVHVAFGVVLDTWASFGWWWLGTLLEISECGFYNLNVERMLNADRNIMVGKFGRSWQSDTDSTAYHSSHANLERITKDRNGMRVESLSLQLNEMVLTREGVLTMTSYSYPITMSARIYTSSQSSSSIL